MRKIFISILAVLSLSFAVHAQQPQSLDFKIDEALALMPAPTAEVYNSVMESFKPQISEFVELLSSRLVPASEGENAKVEYLLNGFISYLSSPDNARYRDEAVKALEKAAEQCQDQPNKDFLEGRMYLLSQYVQPDSYLKLTLPQAKAQLRKKETHLKTEALAAIFDIQGAAALPYAVKAMKTDDREYRVAALHLAEPYADEAFYASLAGMLESGSSSIKLDILRWFGSQRVESQVAKVADLAVSDDMELARTAITALGRIGGGEALETLMSCLGGSNDESAYSALLCFNGDIAPAVVDALNMNPTVSALNLARQRRVYAAYENVCSLLSSDDAALSYAAYDALAGVATAADFYALCDLLETASVENVADIQDALAKVVSVLPSEVCLRRMAKAGDESLYYPVLAEIGDAESVARLMEGYEGGDRQSAMDALLTVDNGGMADVLYQIALADADNADKVLERYVYIINRHVPDPVSRFEAGSRALKLKPSDAVASSLLNTLAGTLVKEVIFMAVPYLQNPATAPAAAAAVKSVAAKNLENLEGEETVRALEAAREQFRKGGTADDGYAIDEINSLLEKL